jgi:hypothetical protein
MALINAFRARGFAADLKTSRNENGELGLAFHQYITVFSTKYLLDVQDREHFDKMRRLVVRQE